jgi:hypothetical protein
MEANTSKITAAKPTKNRTKTKEQNIRPTIRFQKRAMA